MRDFIKNRKHMNNKGFTLVELIVVLLILAILAAILIPILLGYIDEAKDMQHKLDVKNVWTGAQAEFIKLYGNNEYCKVADDKQCVINEKKVGKPWGSNDFWAFHLNANETDLATRVLSNTKEPCMVMVGTGKASLYYNTDRKKAYTVYVVIYQFTDESQPILFYDGNQISYDWPFDNDYNTIKNNKNNNNNYKNLTITRNGEKINLQFYCLRRGYTNDRNSYNVENIWKMLIIPNVKN